MSDCKHETFIKNVTGGDAICADCDMDLDSVRCEEIDILKQELEAANEREVLINKKLVIAEQELEAANADLSRQVKLNEHFACNMCGGIGVVGSPPDDYYDCPECKSFNDMKAELEAAKAERFIAIEKLSESREALRSQPTPREVVLKAVDVFNDEFVANQDGDVWVTIPEIIEYAETLDK